MRPQPSRGGGGESEERLEKRREARRCERGILFSFTGSSSPILCWLTRVMPLSGIAAFLLLLPTMSRNSSEYSYARGVGGARAREADSQRVHDGQQKAHQTFSRYLRPDAKKLYAHKHKDAGVNGQDVRIGTIWHLQSAIRKKAARVRTNVYF